MQPENGEAELALVLHPGHWGLGKTLYDQIIDRAFREMGLKTVTVHLHPSRKRIKGLLKLGFKKDGWVEMGGKQFVRYRLNRVDKLCSKDAEIVPRT